MTKRVLSIDPRSLTVFRVLIGIISLVDILSRIKDALILYTDGGLLPRSIIFLNPNNILHFSLYNLSGDSRYVYFLLGVTCLAAIFLIVGYFPKVSLAVLWILILSIHSRNPYVLNDGDMMLRICLFWALFLPLTTGESNQPIFSVGASCFIVQIAIIYLFTALLKTGSAWRQEGNAIAISLHNWTFTTEFGRKLLTHTRVLHVLTIATYYFELSVPFWLLFPYKPAMSRTLLCGVAIAFHLGILLCMNLGIFPWVCIAAWSLLIPGEVHAFISKLATRVFPSERPQCKIIMREPQEWINIASNVIAASALAFVVSWNLRSLDTKPGVSVKQNWWDTLGVVCRLDQKWSMFAPKPTTSASKLIVIGTSIGGDSFDLSQGTHIDLAQASNIVYQGYPDQRTRTYNDQIGKRKNRTLLASYVRFLAARWRSQLSDHPSLETASVLQISTNVMLPVGQAPLAKSVIYRETFLDHSKNQSTTLEETLRRPSND